VRENDTCTDVDECSQELNPCNPETETCENLVGTHLCKCKKGLVRVESECVVVEKPAPPEPTPTKKLKKKKRKLKKGKVRTDEGPRMFPWYHTVAPLMLLILTYKYTKPNLITSVTILLVLVLAARYV